MRYGLILFLFLIIGKHVYANDILIKSKTSTTNSNSEVHLEINGDYEKKRYKIKPMSSEQEVVFSWDKENLNWISNRENWNEQIFIENIEKIKFIKSTRSYTEIYFEILDQKTGEKSIEKDKKIKIYSYNEFEKYLQSINKTLIYKVEEKNKEINVDKIENRTAENTSQTSINIDLKDIPFLLSGSVFSAYIGYKRNAKMNL